MTIENPTPDTFDGYDDTAAIAFIRARLAPETAAKFDDDAITYFIDLIYDYYGSRGFLDDDDNDEEEVVIDLDEMVDYIVRNARRDEMGSRLPEDIAALVECEMDYCDSLEG